MPDWFFMFLPSGWSQSLAASPSCRLRWGLGASPGAHLCTPNPTPAFWAHSIFLLAQVYIGNFSLLPVSSEMFWVFSRGT